MINNLFFLLHIAIIILATGSALRMGSHALIALLSLQGILSNLFVVKQIELFQFHVTASDAYAVGCIFGLNLLQEYFGKEIAKKAILINFVLILFYLAMTQIHIAYLPSTFDVMHTHYEVILGFMPRIVVASVATFLIVQVLDTQIYHTLQKLFGGKYLPLRSCIALLLSQLTDTTLFALLGLYGIVESVWHIAFVSFMVKIVAIVIISLSTPIISFIVKK